MRLLYIIIKLFSILPLRGIFTCQIVFFVLQFSKILNGNRLISTSVSDANKNPSKEFSRTFEGVASILTLIECYRFLSLKSQSISLYTKYDAALMPTALSISMKTSTPATSSLLTRLECGKRRYFKPTPANFQGGIFFAPFPKKIFHFSFLILNSPINHFQKFFDNSFRLLLQKNPAFCIFNPKFTKNSCKIFFVVYNLRSVSLVFIGTSIFRPAGCSVGGASDIVNFRSS